MSKYKQTGYLVLSKSCNLDCSYCYIDKATRQLPTDEVGFIAFIDKFVAKCHKEGMSFGKLVLHGSEPTMVSADNLAYAINECCTISDVISLQTNGINTADSIYFTTLLGELSDTSLQQLRVGVSIDGTKEVHDEYRDNSYDAAITTVRNFVEAGISVATMCVVTKGVV